jgi:AcrR family transcriptional regulator
LKQDRDTYRALVTAMAESLAARGYEETRVAEVAAVAGCSRATFNRHFPDKEACALAAVETILSDAMSRVSAGYSADTSEWVSALNALAELLDLFSARPEFAKLAFIGSRQALPTGAGSRYREGFSILAAMLDRLRQEGGPGDGAPATAARAAAGGGEALVRRELVAGRGKQLPVFLPDLVYSATVPFLGQKEALLLARQARALVRTR